MNLERNSWSPSLFFFVWSGMWDRILDDSCKEQDTTPDQIKETRLRELVSGCLASSGPLSPRPLKAVALEPVALEARLCS